jgi:hypothetical protein
VFVEQNVSGRLFRGKSDEVCVFNRRRLRTSKKQFKVLAKTLADKSRAYGSRDVRLHNKVGIVVDPERGAENVYSRPVINALTQGISRFGYEVEVLSPKFARDFQFALDLDSYDFLILDVRESLLSPGVLGFVHGRFVPTIKLYHLDEGESPSLAMLPPLLSGYRIEYGSETAEPVIYWHDPKILVSECTRHVQKFEEVRTEFYTREDGDKYFYSIGRRRANVFVSNAGEINDLANALAAGLKMQNFSYFHYKDKDAIPIGSIWLDELTDRLEASEVFVALITDEYHEKQWCQYELKLAREQHRKGKMQIYAYLIGQTSPKGVEDLQIRGLFDLPREEMIQQIVEDIDEFLKRSPPPRVALDVETFVPSVPPVLTETERTTLVEAIARRLTTVTDLKSEINLILIRAHLYERLAGEDFSGSASQVAAKLVTKVEAVGILPARENGGPALVRLIRALRLHYLGEEWASFLDSLAERLSAPNL